ncbi:MAG: class I SAM-dependent methyltransferase [Deltaproteobacteria bacterium]
MRYKKGKWNLEKYVILKFKLFLEAEMEYKKNIEKQMEEHSVVEKYKKLKEEQKVDFIQNIYQERKTDEIYATSPDFNLRELEIDFIKENLNSGKVLDIGCGNGYSLISLARHIESEYVGMDFSENMLLGAQKLIEKFRTELKSIPEFIQGDVRKLPFEDNMFDCVLSERCLLNLPSREMQYDTIKEVYRVLKDDGIYVMVEGTEDGLERLNYIREKMGLDLIPTVSKDNAGSLKFNEKQLNEFLSPMFEIEKIQFFGMYYLISRVIHPLLTYPEKPMFDAKINTIARQISNIIPDVDRIGHVMGYKLKAKK